MTERQEHHLRRLKRDFDELVDKKYRAGALEHGGTLMDAGFGTILGYAIDEAVDQVVYLLTLKSKLLTVLEDSMNEELGRAECGGIPHRGETKPASSLEELRPEYPSQPY